MYLFIDEHNILLSYWVVGIFKSSSFKLQEQLPQSSKLSSSVILLTNNKKLLSPLRTITLYKRIKRQIKGGDKVIIKG